VSRISGGQKETRNVNKFRFRSHYKKKKRVREEKKRDSKDRVGENRKERRKEGKGNYGFSSSQAQGI